jgi:hypothetical protein
MFPDLVAMSVVEDALDERMVGVNIDLTCAEDVSVDLLHVAEVIKHVEAVVA